MSEKPRWLLLAKQIGAIDAEVEAYCGEKSAGLMGLWRRRNADYLRTLYLTGELRKKRLTEATAEVGMPDELLARPNDSLRHELPTGPSDDLPNEILFPKAKRGRPRKIPVTAAHALNCTDRHARRLVASGKSRERDRREPDSSEAWILGKRKERAALVRKLEHDRQLEQLVHGLDCVKYSWRIAAERRKPSRLAQQAAQQIINNDGLPAALVICGYALDDGAASALDFAARVLSVSVATIRRSIGGALKELKQRGADLRATLPRLSKSVTLTKPAKNRRRLVDDDDTAWSMQTTFPSEKGKKTGT